MFYRLIYIPTGVVAADKVELAATVLQKGIGLLGRVRLAEGQGMWFPGVRSVHTFGMLPSIDVLFLDWRFCTTTAYGSVHPLSLRHSTSETKHCIELCSGTLTSEQRHSLGAAWKLELTA